MSGADDVVVHFAGGGTGGHVYPNVAVAERLAEKLAAEGRRLRAVFLVSDRAVDARVVETLGVEAVALPARPPGRSPRAAFAFARGWQRAVRETSRRIAADRPAALLCTGGFVSGPAVVAARRAGVPTALVTLDAVAGRASRFLAKKVDAAFMAVPGAGLPGAGVCGYPVRRASLAASGEPGAARAAYGLEPGRSTLLVFAGSSGAETLNRGLPAFFGLGTVGPRIPDAWQVLHVTGGPLVEEVRAGYAAAGVAAAVVPYEPRLGRAWAAADLAVTRCGAGGVAEAQANAVPCLFLPYPWHRDGHQERNARPLVVAGGAEVMDDAIDSARNAAALAVRLLPLLLDAGRREAMREALRNLPKADGAGVLAGWLLGRIDAT